MRTFASSLRPGLCSSAIEKPSAFAMTLLRPKKKRPVLHTLVRTMDRAGARTLSTAHGPASSAHCAYHQQKIHSSSATCRLALVSVYTGESWSIGRSASALVARDLVCVPSSSYPPLSTKLRCNTLRNGYASSRSHSPTFAFLDRGMPKIWSGRGGASKASLSRTLSWLVNASQAVSFMPLVLAVAVPAVVVCFACSVDSRTNMLTGVSSGSQPCAT